MENKHEPLRAGMKSAKGDSNNFTFGEFVSICLLGVCIMGELGAMPASIYAILQKPVFILIAVIWYGSNIVQKLSNKGGE